MSRRMSRGAGPATPHPSRIPTPTSRTPHREATHLARVSQADGRGREGRVGMLLVERLLLPRVVHGGAHLKKGGVWPQEGERGRGRGRGEGEPWGESRSRAGCQGRGARPEEEKDGERRRYLSAQDHGARPWARQSSLGDPSAADGPSGTRIAREGPGEAVWAPNPEHCRLTPSEERGYGLAKWSARQGGQGGGEREKRGERRSAQEARGAHIRWQLGGRQVPPGVDQ